MNEKRGEADEVYCCFSFKFFVTFKSLYISGVIDFKK